MNSLINFFKKNSYGLGIVLAIIAPVIALFVIYFIVMFIALLIGFKPYGLENFYLLALAVNLILMRYYMVGLKFIRTGKSILVVTFLIVILYFIFQ